MGNADTKLHFRKAVIQLTTKTQPVDVSDDDFWDQFWSDSVTTVQDVFTLLPSAEIRALREESPSNLATLCYKGVEKLVSAADSSCRTQKEQTQVLNSARLLTRLIPYIFEDPDWRSFFWSAIPSQQGPVPDAAENSIEKETEPSPIKNSRDQESVPLAISLLNAVCDLLFCPEFTVAPNKTGNGRDEAEDLQNIDSCEYIWAGGVGFSQIVSNIQTAASYDLHRRELLNCLKSVFSQSMYLPPVGDAHTYTNKWTAHFTSAENRHALPLFTSLLNFVCSYDPAGILPYNHLIFQDTREETVEAALQVLIITLDQDMAMTDEDETKQNVPDNLFLNYLSRIHREEDFGFILKGVTRLLMNPLAHTYLPYSQRKIQFHQELLIFFWKFCEHNKKFLFYVLKSSDVLDILTPILHHLNEARADQSRVGLVHIGVFILLLLSGERNFGVRLNKPYTATVPIDIPVFTGTHADLLVIVFHKIITTGHQRLQPLFDCLLTILCNVSPYIKSLSMMASCKLLHLLEAFSTPWFLFSNPSNHHLVFFLLEMFNNIIQYQFDGNSNLVYTIIRKRQVFHALANLPTDCGAINKTLTKRGKKQLPTPRSDISRQSSVASTLAPSPLSPSATTVETKELPNTQSSTPLEAANYKPGLTAEPGTYKASLMEVPHIDKLTEKSSAHPSQQQLDRLTKAGPSATLFSTGSTATSTVSPSSVTAEAKGSQPEAEQLHQSVGMGIDSYAVGGSNKQNWNLASPSEPPESAAQIARMPSSSVEVAQPLLEPWVPSQEWVTSWKNKLPLQTIMRLLQVLVPQVEKICIDRGLTDESEILRFLQHGTLVGLLPVPHPILIRKYQPNPGTALWFRTYMWGVVYLRNTDPPIWYDTDVKLFEIQRV